MAVSCAGGRTDEEGPRSSAEEQESSKLKVVGSSPTGGAMNEEFYCTMIEKMKSRMRLLHHKADSAWTQQDIESHREHCIAANDMMGAIRALAKYSKIVPFQVNNEEVRTVR